MLVFFSVWITKKHSLLPADPPTLKPPDREGRRGHKTAPTSPFNYNCNHCCPLPASRCQLSAGQANSWVSSTAIPSTACACCPHGLWLSQLRRANACHPQHRLLLLPMPAADVPLAVCSQSAGCCTSATAPRARATLPVWHCQTLLSHWQAYCMVPSPAPAAAAAAAAVPASPAATAAWSSR